MLTLADRRNIFNKAFGSHHGSRVENDICLQS